MTGRFTPRNGTSRAARGHGSATRSGRRPSPDRAAWEKERQDARDELKAQVWLPADNSRRLRAIAARTGLGPEQLAQLADRVRMDDDGALTGDAFTPR
ncbi:hypothetical protein [Streptomyces sp. 2A115]|uniref:hypothetical protein n=1 Tax=Streptomyces sp. 2A115 TaxID=3457439 RepID=UPI003FD07088